MGYNSGTLFEEDIIGYIMAIMGCDTTCSRTISGAVCNWRIMLIESSKKIDASYGAVYRRSSLDNPRRRFWDKVGELIIKTMGFQWDEPMGSLLIIDWVKVVECMESPTAWDA